MSRVNYGAKPIMLPQPVLIIGTYDENGVPNAMNAAWGITTDFKEITISLSEHKTTDNFKSRKAFTVSMATEDYVVACDYVGIISGNDEPDKLKKAGFTVSASSFVDAPVINELPMCLECELVSYDVKTGCMVGNIINVCAEESVLTDDKIDPAKLEPITYDPVNHTYRKLGEIVGKAFSDGKQVK